MVARNIGILSLVAASLFNLARATSGCSLSSSPWKFDNTNHANRTIGDRSFYVHIPATYKQNAPHPVVLSYHGYGETPTIQESISSLSDDSLRINNSGIIAVYPFGSYGPGKEGNESITAWQGAPYAAPGVNDIEFTTNIISELEQNLCVDTNRIYACGKSEGGGFTNLLACTNSTSSLIAAYAPVSAALYEGTLPFQGCDNVSRPVPLINFHGLADPIIPYGGQLANNVGNKSYALPNITVWREEWATRNGCPAGKIDEMSQDSGMQFVAYTWNCSQSDDRAVVHGFSVMGLGHSWPSIQGLDGQKTPFNATNQYIVPFFQEYALDYAANYTSGGQNSSGTNQSSSAPRSVSPYGAALPYYLSCCLLLLALVGHV
ncbi:hypothetical protein AcV5_005583 [Taiwanofungus camphoratus]|nr:hypothetical protein AcV5_005583 [Antrodia cinnamomea]